MVDRVQRAAGKLSAAHRWGYNIPEAEANLQEAQLEKSIVAGLPKLTDEARERLAQLLRGGDVL